MSSPAPLAERLKSCGPVVDAGAAERAREVLAEAAGEGGWAAVLERAWPALAPVFGASPYLAGLAKRRPQMLKAILEGDPDARLEAILSDAAALEAQAGDAEAVREGLRRLKARLHLLTALCDLGGVWALE